MIDLGPEHTFTQLPAPVDVHGQPYFLERLPHGGYRLLSRVCPHQGGVITRADSCFECPQHGWRFDLDTGQGIDVPQTRLTCVPVTVRDGHLWAAVASQAVAATTQKPRSHAWPDGFSVRLIAHACLEIRHGGFSLLTDPWLCGPSFLGAWMPYPAIDLDVTTLRPDAIWISHEHSDHFHPATLQHFDRRTPVYVPDFPNGRLAAGLAAMGFSHVTCMRFGQPYDIADGIRLTCYEPPGLWNDSMLLVEAGGVRLLNINDAGVNHRIASLIGPVDILASAYNPASSYPFAWSHLTPQVKEDISRRARLGMLRMLHQAVQRYQPRYLLPFAAHFTLWHPSHREYLSQLQRNTLDDVVRAFRHTDLGVLDMLPGGHWHPARDTFDRGADRTHLYDPDYQMEWVSRAFDERLFAAHHPAPGAPAPDALTHYLLRLNDVPDIEFCEDVSVRLHTGETQDGVDMAFQVAGGRLSIGSDAEPNLTMEVPAAVLRHLVEENASWDEAHVGFWCRFTRTPDVFHAGFWRLLQAPYYGRSAGLREAPAQGSIAADTSITRLLEGHGVVADRILARYGLHCGGCPHAPAESLTLAARRHGLDDGMTSRLLRELNVTLGPMPVLARG